MMFVCLLNFYVGLNSKNAENPLKLQTCVDASKGSVDIGSISKKGMVGFLHKK